MQIMTKVTFQIKKNADFSQLGIDLLFNCETIALKLSSAAGIFIQYKGQIRYQLLVIIDLFVD